MKKAAASIGWVLLAWVALVGSAEARRQPSSRFQDGYPSTRQAQPGDFDYYRLALSWSPEFCDTPGGRSPAKQDQCARSLGFVVHCLWPQYRRGYPTNCGPSVHVPAEVAAPALTASPPMPPGDPGLIDHEWVKHGTCTGLDMAEYFRRIKQAAEKVRIPPELQGPHLPVDSDFKAIAAMFRAVNPGLTEDMLEIIADRGGRISEVHVCFDKQLEFQTCPSTRRRTGGRFLPVQ